MKLTTDYQLQYEGQNTVGQVAKSNIQDYQLIVGQLPLALRNSVKKINQHHLIDSLLRVHDYTYTNYKSAVHEVNDLLRNNRDILDRDKDLFERIDRALNASHEATRKGDNHTMDYESFKEETNDLMAKGKIQGAIRKSIERYGLSKVDNHFKDIGIHRDDKLNYYYYPYGLSNAEPTEPKDFEVEDVIANCEYK